jgi:hypothetical protein
MLSHVKMKKKLNHIFRLTSCLANSVLSPCGRGLSTARTTQLAMMVSRTVYSNGGHSIKNLVALLMKLDSLRMKSEVGPSFFSSTFFFLAILAVIAAAGAAAPLFRLGFVILTCSSICNEKVSRRIPLEVVGDLFHSGITGFSWFHVEIKC